MRTPARTATGLTALVILLSPGAALADSHTTDDASDTDRTFVPTFSSEDGAVDADVETDADADELPHTGGGLAILGGLAIAGAAALGRRR